jgi:uncharacterized protein YdaT
MPWEGTSFAKHNKKLAGKPGAAKKAGAVATAILREGGDEGKAIRIANSMVGKFIKKHKGK